MSFQRLFLAIMIVTFASGICVTGQEQAVPPDLAGLRFQSIERVALISMYAGGTTHPTFWPLATFTPEADKVCHMFVPPGPTCTQLRVNSLPDGKVLSESLAPSEFRTPASPSLSPDGKTLLFTGLLGIWRTDLQGSTPTRITPVGDHFSSPDWSPRGDNIVCVKFESEDPDQPDRASLVFMDTEPPYTVQRELQLNLVMPRYSPDGKWIACQQHGTGKLGVLRVESGKFYPLLDHRTVELSFSRTAYGGLGSYMWLPDSERLLVNVSSSDEVQHYSRVFMVNLRGEVREMFDGWVLGGPQHGRILFVYVDGQVWRVDLAP